MYETHHYMTNSGNSIFKPSGGRFRHISCEIHLQEGIKSNSESKSISILCVGKDGHGSIRHICVSSSGDRVGQLANLLQSHGSCRSIHTLISLSLNQPSTF